MNTTHIAHLPGARAHSGPPRTHARDGLGGVGRVLGNEDGKLAAVDKLFHQRAAVRRDKVLHLAPVTNNQ